MAVSWPESENPQPSACRRALYTGNFPMSSTYGITKTDLVDGLISETEYKRGLAKAGGDDPAELTGIVTQAEGVIHGAARGVPAGTALQALFKPYVLTAVLYWLHFRRCQQDNAKVPETVADNYTDALEWAKDSGRNLIDAEKAGAGLTADFPVVAGQTPVFTRQQMRGF